jgi:LacI family transcriptional regulator
LKGCKIYETIIFEPLIFDSFKKNQMSGKHVVTIKDIAERLKISVSTVSRALRNGSEIKKETRLLVRKLATELNYTPNPIALSLKERKSKMIGIVVPEIANTYCSATIAGMEDVAYAKGYHVMIFQSHEKYEREKITTQLLASRRMDGLIISLSSETNRYDHLNEMIEKGIPVVMFDRIYEGLDTHKVVADDYGGAFQATEHLIEQGFRNIAHVTMASFLSITQNRMSGFKDALKKHNVPFREDWVLHCNFNTDEMSSKIGGLFAGKLKPDAVLASSERLVIACMNQLKAMDLHIPGDVALIGFCDNPLNHLLQPSLSCVRQPTFEIGQKSAELLIELIEKKTPVKKYKTVRLGTTLDIGASSMKSR